MNIVHLSLHNSIKDGGIFFYVNNLQDFQNSIGLHSYWITCRENNIKIKVSKILNSIKDLNPDIIHVHGLWTIQTRLIPDLLKITKNLIVAPHGMLHQNALKKSAWKKKLAFFLYEKKNLEKSIFFHALDKEEKNNIKNIFPNKRVFIIGAGIRIPIEKSYDFKPSWLKRIKENDRIILYLGRLEEQKGIPELLRSWLELKKETKKYKSLLLIAGFGKYEKEIENLSLDETNRIIFTGLALGEMKKFILNLSDAFILPSKYEGVPISFLEAISYRCLCLVTKECKLRKLRKYNSSIDIHLDPKKMKKDLISFMKLTDQEIKVKTTIALNYIREEHDWYKVGKLSEKYYTKITSERI